MTQKSYQVIFEQTAHRWLYFYNEKNVENDWIDTNEYIIEYHGKALLTDPGGIEVFPALAPAIDEAVELKKIDFIFASHQDPDIISSLPLWLRVNPGIRFYVPSIWLDYISNFGGEPGNYITIPDRGVHVNLNGLQLETIPAHYLHSPGTQQLFDHISGILFSADVGSSLLPKENHYLFVEDFKEHIKYMEFFHTRWFGSNSHKNEWCERVSKLKINMLCPQHGAIFKGDDVKRFIDWFHELNVGGIGSI